MFAYLRKASRTAHDRGASAVEYGLMVAAIAAVIVAVVFGLGTVVRNTFQNTCEAVADNPNGPVVEGCAPAGAPPAGG